MILLVDRFHAEASNHWKPRKSNRSLLNTLEIAQIKTSQAGRDSFQLLPAGLLLLQHLSLFLFRRQSRKGSVGFVAELRFCRFRLDNGELSAQAEHRSHTHVAAGHDGAHPEANPFAVH